MMKKTIEHLIHALEVKTSLSPLYKRRSIVIELHSEVGPLWLSITSEGHRLSEESPADQSVSLVITGKSDADLEQALKGKRPLLTLKEEGKIQIEGPFNDQLTLESLLILSSQHSFLVV